MNNYVSKLAGDLQKSNMQKHMGAVNSGVDSKKAEILHNIIKYEYEELIRLIYITVLGRDDRYSNGQIVMNHFLENESDLIPIFKNINEKCLTDPNLSLAIAENKPYAKKIGSLKRDILFYPPNRVNSMSHDVFMDLYYIPSTSEDSFNRFRINVKEKPISNQGYPYLNFSVDLLDNGKIQYNRPMIVDKVDKNDESFIQKTPTDMSSAHIRFNKKGVEAVNNLFEKIFENVSEIEKNSNRRM